MDYPKKVMKLTELIEVGFPRDYLLNAYYTKNQRFAWKMNLTKKTSPILFDTDLFEEYRQKQIDIELQAKKHLQAVI